MSITHLLFILCDENGNLSTSVISLPIAHKDSVNMKKKISPVGHPTKYLTSTPQNYQVIKKEESLRNHHSQRRPKET